MTSHSYIGVHPERVIAYALVRHPPTLRGRKPIFAIGALEINLQNGTDAIFKRHHRVYQREAVGDPFADIFNQLSPGTHRVSAQPIRPAPPIEDRSADHRRRDQIAGRSLLQSGRGQHHIMRTRERTLRAFARDYSIPIAAQNASKVQQARLVPDRAQIIWLAWVTTALCADPDQEALIAAFCAWRLLDEQRLIPF